MGWRAAGAGRGAARGGSRQRGAPFVRGSERGGMSEARRGGVLGGAGAEGMRRVALSAGGAGSRVNVSDGAGGPDGSRKRGRTSRGASSPSAVDKGAAAREGGAVGLMSRAMDAARALGSPSGKLRGVRGLEVVGDASEHLSASSFSLNISAQSPPAKMGRIDSLSRRVGAAEAAWSAAPGSGVCARAAPGACAGSEGRGPSGGAGRRARKELAARPLAPGAAGVDADGAEARRALEERREMLRVLQGVVRARSAAEGRALLDGLQQRQPSVHQRAVFWVTWSRLEEGLGQGLEAAQAVLERGLRACSGQAWEEEVLHQASHALLSRRALPAAPPRPSAAADDTEALAATDHADIDLAAPHASPTALDELSRDVVDDVPPRAADDDLPPQPLPRADAAAMDVDGACGQEQGAQIEARQPVAPPRHGADDLSPRRRLAFDADCVFPRAPVAVDAEDDEEELQLLQDSLPEVEVSGSFRHLQDHVPEVEPSDTFRSFSRAAHAATEGPAATTAPAAAAAAAPAPVAAAAAAAASAAEDATLGHVFVFQRVHARPSTVKALGADVIVSPVRRSLRIASTDRTPQNGEPSRSLRRPLSGARLASASPPPAAPPAASPARNLTGAVAHISAFPLHRSQAYVPNPLLAVPPSHVFRSPGDCLRARTLAGPPTPGGGIAASGTPLVRRRPFAATPAGSALAALRPPCSPSLADAHVVRVPAAITDVMHRLRSLDTSADSAQ
jgi:hypothetical protein